MQIFGIGTVLALIAAGVVYSLLQVEKRREEMTAGAARLGFDFQEKDVNLKLPELQIFSRGHSRVFGNILSRTEGGKEIKILDYCFITGSGKGRHVHNQTVIVFKAAELSLPPFALAPESIFDKIGSLLGMQDVDFPEYPQFSKMYRLQTGAEQEIRARFNPELLRYLERNPGCYVEASDNALVFYREGKMCPATDIEKFWQEGAALYSLFRAA